jgi:S1-C subfamily serine protease
VVKVAERPVPAAAQGRTRPTDPRQALASDQGPLGLTVRDLDAASALRRALPDSIRGVVVVEVDPAGPARLARVRTGQMILEVNRTPTPTADRYEAVLASVPAGLAVVALVYDPITDRRALVAITPDRQP